MTLYLVKFYNEHYTWYKRGHTKYHDPLKGRYGDHYLWSQGVKIELLAKQIFSHDKWIVAKTMAETAEHLMNCTWPCKNDPDIRIEERLQVQEFDGMLDGATEFIYLKEGQSEQDIIDHFEQCTNDLWKVGNKL